MDAGAASCTPVLRRRALALPGAWKGGFMRLLRAQGARRGSRGGPRVVAEVDFSTRMGAYLGIEAPPAVSSGLARTADFAAAHLQWSERPEPELMDIDRDEAFLVFVLRQSLPSNPYWVDGRPEFLAPRSGGQFNLLDTRRKHAAEVWAAVDCMALYLPLDALNALTDGRGMPRVSTLDASPGEALTDPVIWHLSESLMPGLTRPDEASSLFVEEVGLALSWHVLHRYGGLSAPTPVGHGGLAPWQERKAKEMLTANLAGGVTLGDLANACRLSRSHFARCFKVTTGLPSHRWLARYRVERAKDLLIHSSKSLEQIAEECGFADRSHFARSFVKWAGATPARWRRDRQW